jgi:DNA-binding CsgD family transcriptional regulator
MPGGNMDARRAVSDALSMTAATAPVTPAGPGWIRYPLSARLLRDLGYLVVALPMAVLSFTVFVTGLSVTLSLIVFVVGFPVALAWFWVNRGLADLQRARAAWVLGELIPGAYRRPTDSGLAARIRTGFRDPQTYRVAEGGTALDPEAVAKLFARRRGDGPFDELTPREREVLALMAEGRSNAAIARDLVVTEGAVEKHISSIFGKLGLPPSEEANRRVVAVLAYLRG